METEQRRAFGLPIGDWLAAFASPRYLSLGLSLYIAMYAGLKFVLVLFGAADVSDRWVFELSPAFLLNLPDPPLAFLSALVAGANAHFHRSIAARDRLRGMALSTAMAVSLAAALWVPGPGSAGANPYRLAMLFLVLFIVPLDQRALLATPAATQPARFAETLPADEEASGESTPQARTDWDLENVLSSLGEFEGPTAATTASLDETLQGLEDLLRDAEVDTEATPRGTPRSQAQEESDLEAEGLFVFADLEAFERWLETDTPPDGGPREQGSEADRGDETRISRVRRIRRLNGDDGGARGGAL